MLETTQPSTYWSGCNYNINQGKHEAEPIGTAQSLHDCDGCSKLPHCTVKQPTETWAWNEEIDKILTENWKRMHNQEPQ